MTAKTVNETRGRLEFLVRFAGLRLDGLTPRKTARVKGDLQAFLRGTQRGLVGYAVEAPSREELGVIQADVRTLVEEVLIPAGSRATPRSRDKTPAMEIADVVVRRERFFGNYVTVGLKGNARDLVLAVSIHVLTTANNLRIARCESCRKPFVQTGKRMSSCSRACYMRSYMRQRRG